MKNVFQVNYVALARTGIVEAKRWDYVDPDLNTQIVPV
jgi:hypothetical protein